MSISEVTWWSMASSNSSYALWWHPSRMGLGACPGEFNGPPAQSPGFKFQLTILKQNLGNFHWYWDITARRPASWHPLVNMSTPQVSVPTSAKTLLPPASVPAALLMMVSPQPSATTITAYFWRFITWSLPRIHRLGQLQNEKERWRRSTTTTTTTTTAQWSESILVLERNMLQRILESKVWKNTNSPEHSTDLYAFPKHPTYSTTVTSYMGGHCDALAPMGGPNAHHATPNSGNYEYNLGSHAKCLTYSSCMDAPFTLYPSAQSLCGPPWCSPSAFLSWHSSLGWDIHQRCAWVA